MSNPASTSRMTIAGPMSRSFEFRLEQFLEEPGDRAVRRLHDVDQFSLVEPDPVAVGAAVELDGLEPEGRHRGAAADAFPLPMLRLAGRLQRLFQPRQAARPVGDLLELA